MQLTVSLPVLTWPLAMLVFTGCGRTTATNGAAEAATALVKAEEAAAGSTAVTETVLALESRVTTAEETLGAQELRLATVETATSTMATGQADLAGRVEVLEAQDLVGEVNSGIASGAIDVSFEPGFSPYPEVDPRINPSDSVPEFGASTTLAQAVSALRYANQVRYTPRGTTTRLGALQRNYVQEAIDALDRELDSFDGELDKLFSGAKTPGLDTTSLPKDGSYDDIQSAVEDLYQRLKELERLRELERGPYILGVTAPSTGEVTHDGRTGVLGAAGLCRASFPAEPDAHLCALDEARQALAGDRFATDIANVTTWSLGGSLAESCNGLRTADATSFGTTHTLDLSQLNAVALGVETTTEPCNIEHPLLCCR